ncbi:hypothetical protein [Nocardia puris]|uniref:Uncharacterized protein n=1 Tax=Nocardia puris TaxID=208602 RepID=A0A366D5E1_9NOCA|nr:hypothetical protein [Nocardia puris]RBO85242.1 hypothetical protein DFR74_11590 [Nocardia puris]
MSNFDDALASARRDAEWRIDIAQSDQRSKDALAEQVTHVLAEASEQFRALPEGLRLQLARPKKLFERTSSGVTDVDGKRYVVIDEQRCWIVPPYGGRSHGSDVLFTERGELFYVLIHGRFLAPGGPPDLISPDPLAIPVATPPSGVDVAKEFSHGRHYGEEQERDAAVIRALRSALAQCFVEYERALGNSEPIEDLFQKWPIQWRSG